MHCSKGLMAEYQSQASSPTADADPLMRGISSAAKAKRCIPTDSKTHCDEREHGWPEQKLKATADTAQSRSRDTQRPPSSISAVASQQLQGYPGVTRTITPVIKATTRENQVKLTVSVPPSLHVLLRSWAVCEGRELTSVVLQCVELSVRQMKSNGSIPAAAVRNYEAACDDRLAMGGL